MFIKIFVETIRKIPMRTQHSSASAYPADEDQYHTDNDTRDGHPLALESRILVDLHQTQDAKDHTDNRSPGP